MKQHITKEQWDELSEDKKRVVKKFFRKKPYVEAVCCDWLLLDIGQMIEFLGGEWWRRVSEAWINVEHKEVKTWDTVVGNEDLCDALWEAVKHKLNQDD